MAHQVLFRLREDRWGLLPEALGVTNNIRGLMNALRQSINEAILESNDVAVAMAALRRTGKLPVFTIDVSLQDPPGAEPAPAEAAEGTVAAKQELTFSDPDVAFLSALGISDPAWFCGTTKSKEE